MKPLRSSLIRDLKLPEWWGRKLAVGYNVYRVVFVDIEFETNRRTNRLYIAIERSLENHETTQERFRSY